MHGRGLTGISGEHAVDDAGAGVAGAGLDVECGGGWAVDAAGDADGGVCIYRCLGVVLAAVAAGVLCAVVADDGGRCWRTFVTLDLLLFFVFFQLALVPLYFLVGIWGVAA